MGGVARSYFAQLAVHDIFHYFPLGDMRRAAEHDMGRDPARIGIDSICEGTSR